MIVGLSVAGSTPSLLHAMLELLVDHNAAYYRSLGMPASERIDAMGVRYRPDEPSDSIVLVSAAMLGTHASCGSAAAAWAGWHRAAWRTARIELSLVSSTPMVFHAVAIVDGWGVWDPATRLQK